MNYKKLVTVFLSLFLIDSVFVGRTTSAYATTIRDAVQQTLTTNPEALAAQRNSEAYKKYVDEEEGGYFPTVDIEAYYENKKTQRKPDGQDNTETKSEGTNIELKLEQVLYDGGLVASKVSSAKYSYQANKFKNSYRIGEIVFETVDAYLQLVKYQELMALAEDNLKTHEDILLIAKSNEDVSGESLDRIQAESRTERAYSTYSLQKNDKEKALSKYKRVVGSEPDGLICRPFVNIEDIPSNLALAIEESIRSNFKIQEQISNIKEQRAKLSEEKSRFLPTIKFQFQGSQDHDLLADDTKTNTYSSKILLSYNLFNGGKDKASHLREKIFLQESQKTLDEKTREIEDNMKVSYKSYNNAKERVEYLKKYVALNKEIVRVYQDQFEGGTRTIMDLLNGKDELYRAKTDLVEEEFRLYTSYYEIISHLSQLTNKILMDENQVCKEFKVDIDESVKIEDEYDEELLAATMEEEPSESELALEKEEEFDRDKMVNDMLNDILSEVYESKQKVSKTVEVEAEIEKEDKVFEQPKEEEIKQPKAAEETKEEKAQAKKEVVIDIEPVSLQDIKEPVEAVRKEKAIKQLELTAQKEAKKKIKEAKEAKEKTKDEEPIQEEQKDTIFRTNIDKNVFLSIPPSYYTINLATLNNFVEADELMRRYKLDGDLFIFEFGEDKKLTKILYDSFATSKDAKDAISRLYPRLQENKPYYVKIEKFQKLYKKYYINHEIKTLKTHIVKEPEETIFTEADDEKLIEEETEPLIFNNDFLNASPDFYTINITTLPTLKEAKWFINRYGIKDKAFIYSFGKDKRLIKVIYGIFESVKQANSAMIELHPRLHDNNPYVDKLSKHQKLYKKYNKE